MMMRISKVHHSKHSMAMAGRAMDMYMPQPLGRWGRHMLSRCHATSRTDRSVRSVTQAQPWQPWQLTGMPRGRIPASNACGGRR